MKTADLLSTPVSRVWAAWPETKPLTFMWDRDDPEHSDLTDLLPFEEYTVTADADCRVDRNDIVTGEHQVVWNVTLGDTIDYGNWWKFGRDELKQTGFWPLLRAYGARGLQVVKEFPPGLGLPTSGGQFSVLWPDDILCLDYAVFPAIAFPADMLHEAKHIWQFKNDRWGDIRRVEDEAYCLTQAFLLAAGYTDINVWDAASAFPVASGELANWLK